jgi:hypothetical protein
MARIFNIYFTYNGTVLNGMVSVRTTPFYREYTLSFSDEVMELLPCNKIISTTPNQYQFLHSSNASATPLMQEVIRAVAEHLQTTEA